MNLRASVLWVLVVACSPAKETGSARPAAEPVAPVANPPASTPPPVDPDPKPEPDPATIDAGTNPEPIEVVELPSENGQRCYGVKGAKPTSGGGGKLPPEVISALPKPSPWRTCTDRARKKHSLIGGKLLMRFTIERDGSVRRACSEKSDIEDPELVACFLRALVERRFPRPEGGVVHVVYPLLINPSD